MRKLVLTRKHAPTAEELLAPPSCTALDTARANLALLIEQGITNVVPWLAYWPEVDALRAVAAPETLLGKEVEKFEAEARAACRAAIGVADLGLCVPAARALVSAAHAVFTGQPETTAWPSRIGRTVSAEAIVGEYTTLKAAMAVYGDKIELLDQAIKLARDNEVLWLLPEGSLRCPTGAKEILQHFAAGQGLISSADATQEFSNFLRSLAMFSTPGRSQETLNSLLNPFKQEMLEYAKEARLQLELLVKAGAGGDGGKLLLERPFHFRGVELATDSGSAMVLGTLFWIASGVIVAVIANSLPPLVTAGIALGLFGVSTLCAVIPARNAREDHWQRAVDQADHTYNLLRAALVAPKKTTKPAADGKPVSAADGKPVTAGAAKAAPGAAQPANAPPPTAAHTAA